MPLPEGKALTEPWPPAPYGDTAQVVYDEIQAWWAGTPESLDSYYRGSHVGQRPAGALRASQYNGGVSGWVARKFWGEPPSLQSGAKQRLHLPLAADIIQTSGRLLFSEPMGISFAAPKVSEGGTTVSTKETEGSPTSSRLDKIVNADQMYSSLLLGGELQAGLGGVYGRIVADKKLSDTAWFDFVDADRAVPEFRWGRLVGVTFWTILERDDSGKGGWLRHLECHEPGRVLHALYRGEKDRLGQPMPLAAHPVTRALTGGDDVLASSNGIAIPTGIDELAVDYIPNATMNPVWRNIHQLRDFGRPDLTSDVIGVLDALDETYTSLMRDIRLGKGRLSVTAALLRSGGVGRGTEFDLDQDVYEGLGGDPNNPQIQMSQFAIRVDEHLRSGSDLMTLAVRKAGYSPFTFGIANDGSAATATEVKSKASHSFETRKLKLRYWSTFFQRMVPRLLAIDSNVYGVPAPTTEDLEIDWPPPVRDTDLERAQTVAAWETAKVAALETKIRYIHPDWDDIRIEKEIKALEEEAEKAAPPDPFAIGEEGAGGETPPGFDDQNSDNPVGNEPPAGPPRRPPVPPGR